MSDEEHRGGHIQSVHRRIGDTITARYPDIRLNEVTRALVRRQKKLASRVSEALKDLLAKRDGREQAQWAFPIPKKRTDGQSTDTLLDNAPVAAFAGAFLGCLTTLDFSAFGIVPGIASALATALLCGQLLVTRTTSLFAGAFFPALYGGTFAGMTPVLWLSDNASGHSATLTGALFILLSIVCGLAFFVVAKLDTRSAAPIGSGYGGRLGAIATVASFLFIELVGLLGVDASRFHDVRAGAFAIEPWASTLGFFACLVGIFGTLFVLRQRRIASAGVADRIFVASAVALVGLMALHLSNPNDAHASDAFYAGCFLGMSKPERLKGWFQPVFGALVLTAVLVLVRAFLPGVGGGLGFAAFVTVALFVALRRVTAWMTREIPTRIRSLATKDQATPRDRNHPYSPDHAEPRESHAAVDESERDIVIDRSGTRRSLERTVPDPLSELRGSSTLATLALGAAIATAPIAAFLVVGWLPHQNAATPDRLAEEVPGSIGTTASEPVAGQSATSPPQVVIGEAAPGPVDDLIPLSISPTNAADGDVVALSSLPSASNTDGPPSATSGWHPLFAHELDNAAIRPALGFVGGADVAVELRRSEWTVDRPAPHLEWTSATPPIIGPSTGRPLLHEVAEDHEAIFREFLQFISHATPETRRRPRPAQFAGVARRPPRAGQSASAYIAPARPPNGVKQPSR